MQAEALVRKRFQPKITEHTWNKEIENEIRKEWESEKIYRFAPTAKRRFVIDTPPPYPSGRPWHIGAAAHYSQIDMVARAARMIGYSVLFPIGIDRNGLPVERYTEKMHNISIRDIPREKFLELCKTALDDLESEMIWIMKTMGISGDFENHYRTDARDYRRLTQATFIEMWRQSLIYQATRPNNFCYDCGTTIADAEIEYEELPAKLAYMVFKVKETGEPLVIASTRPELLCSCQAIIINPDDERYKHLQGKHAVVCFYGREVPIIAHSAARPEFGTGAVMICSYGDYTDVLLFRELGLEEIVAIDEAGLMTEAAGILQGLMVKEARERMMQVLKEKELLEKVEHILHRTPMCGRSDTVIEIIPMPEYYLKQLEFVPKLKELAHKMKFYPKLHRQLLLDWIGSLTIDWPISRRRYYATEIPIWYCENCGKAHVPEPGPYYQPWRQPAPFQKCQQCGSTGFVGETRTLDTWMDSSVSPLYITRYLRDEEFFRRNYPTSLRPQGKDIVRTWLHYTILRCYQLTDEAPFKHAWIGGMGLDERGQPMSKSRGNVIDPIPILEKYGADVFRFWSAQEASHGYDFRVSENRIAGAQKFLTKLWNLARFISSFPQPRRAVLTPSDRWILAELSKLIEECGKGYGNFDFYVPATRCRDWIWNLFAAHYVEMAKPRAYGSSLTLRGQQAAWFTLHTCLKTLLLLLAPITPFITDALWQRIYKPTSVHGETFPKARWDRRYTRYSEALTEFNSMVWRSKKDRGLSLSSPIDRKIPKHIRPFRADLEAMHKIRRHNTLK